MCNGERICSAQAALEGLTAESYSLFDQGEVDKRVSIWQPNARIDDLHSLPNPEPAMKQMAKGFLQKANEGESDLAVAPEWAYNLEWVPDHSDLLFSTGSPLFVLGSAPMRRNELEGIIQDLENKYIVLPEEVPEFDSEEFVTPTIIPIRTASSDENQDDAVLIQYKNQPMGDGVNSNEEVNLVEGEFVWKIDPSESQSEVAIITCSDIMDFDLKNEIAQFARNGNSFVVHPQCNPSPFSEIWTRFRREIFGGGHERVTYVSANWGKIETGMNEWRCGYSGVYTKAQNRPPLKKYDKTYLNGGLPGTMPSSHCEFVWGLPGDSIFQIQFKRRNPATAGPGGPSFSLPHINKTWVWEGDGFFEGNPGIPECESKPCDSWRSSLPESPRAVELISSIALGKIDIDEITGSDPFIPNQHFVWSALLNLQSQEDELLGHVLADHNHRSDPPPTEAAEMLSEAFKLANDKLDISPAEDFHLDKIPVNATYDEKDIPICLTIVDNATKSAENKRATWLKDWSEVQERRFKPIMVTTNRDEGWVLKTIPEYERVDSSVSDPERVDAAGGLLGGER